MPLAIAFLSAGPLVAQESEQRNSIFESKTVGGIQTMFLSNEDEPDESNGYFRVALSPREEWLAARNKANEVELFDLTAEHFAGLIPSQNGWVEAMSFSPDGTSLFAGSGSADQPVRVWEVPSCKLQKQFSFSVGNVTLSPEQSVWFGANNRNRIRMEARPPFDVELENLSSNERESCCVDASGKWLVSRKKNVANTTLLCIEYVASGQLYYLGTINGTLRHVQFSPTENLVAGIFYGDADLYVWREQNSGFGFRRLDGHRDKVLCLTISNDGRFLISCDASNQMQIREVVSGTLVGTFEIPGMVQCLATSQYGHLIAGGELGDKRSHVFLWDLESLLKQALSQTAEPAPDLLLQLGDNDPLIGLQAAQSVAQLNSTDLTSLMDSLNLNFGEDEHLPTMDEILDLLDSTSFHQRQQATGLLLRQKRRFAIELAKIRRQDLSPETRYRIESVLEAEPSNSDSLSPDDRRRFSRLLWGLERSPCAEAASWIERIAWFHESPWVSNLALHAMASREAESAGRK
jgi:WD40 repeat protein